MGTPYLGEIKIISWNFAPEGWAFCNGRVLAYKSKPGAVLDIGVRHTVVMAELPLRFRIFEGRTPIYTGQGFVLGREVARLLHTLTFLNWPLTHVPNCNVTAGAANLGVVTSNYWADGGKSIYSTAGPNTAALLPQATNPVGGSQPHENMSPYLVSEFHHRLAGVFPSQN